MYRPDGVKTIVPFGVSVTLKALSIMASEFMLADKEFRGITTLLFHNPVSGFGAL